MLTRLKDDLDIYIYKNFIKQHELDLILSEISRADREDLWESAVGSENEPTWVNRNFCSHNHSPELEDLSRDIFWRVVQAFSEGVTSLLSEYLRFSGIGPINRTMVGQSLAVHDDMGPPELNAPVTHGIVIYFNDNFEGGELYYPGLGVSLKPEPGTLVVHPSTAKYEHGVAQVTKGVRYGTTMFVFQPN